MSEETYRYLGGGQGRVALPEDMQETYGDVWDLRRYRWSGGENWRAQRHQESPLEAVEFGVVDDYAGWSRPELMWDWLREQAEAMQAFERAATDRSTA
ncbi:hypothetical protein [Streptomonospora litoralis]|uniref:Uncharacterized protein n=1 Tax=Streptomonospora litoralis TaxID=2498135 RepID=A0A4P6QB51_9ACTN|nr:hypothetical protein [Streptomonospora litoralis]QBI56774.1 hypothetical protein EKD16_25165 [Streptomonospora litoralis]